MARVRVDLPAMLAGMLGAPRRVDVDARTLAEALRRAIEAHPGLEVHLFDEQGRFRKHVLCYVNQSDSRWLASRDAALGDGDVITILQAVSGG